MSATRQDEPTSDGVLVIGAGMVGVSAALALQQEGLAVALVDRGAPGEGASFGNAGLLAASSNVPVNTPGLIRRAMKMLADPLPALHLRWSYLPRMAPWLLAYLRRCDAATATMTAAHIDLLIHDCLDRHRALAKGTKAAQRIRSMPYLFAYPGHAAYEADGFTWSLRRAAGWQWTMVTGAAVRDLEPELAPRYDCLAVFENQHGFISEPGAYVGELADAFVERGGRLIRASVQDFDFVAGRPVAAITDQGRLPFQTAVIAAGAWSARLTAKLGIKIPLEAERGYHVEFKDPSVRPRHSIQISDGKCVATPMDHALRIAGLVEFGGLEAGPSTRPGEVLRARAKALLPALEFTEQSEWLGHRPATSDSLPVIGPTKKHDNIHLAFGHAHVGLTGGPRTGQLIADGIVGRRPNIDLTAYRPERFS